MRKVDLLGARYAICRGFPWSVTFRRREPGPGRRPIDLTGFTARFEVYDSLREHRPPWMFGALIEAPQTGVVKIPLRADDTRALRTTAARYRLVFTDSLGDESVLLYGRLAVLESDR